MLFQRIVLIVLDSVGIGEAPDAALFGDEGSHTLGHIAEFAGLKLPHLASMGLGNIAPLPGLLPKSHPLAHFGKLQEVSRGKDTMTGHWELMGLRVDIPFQTYAEGFPNELIEEFTARTGRKVLGNRVASGTEIIAELGPQQMKTGDWIVYTSADSVFQIAAHEEVIPLQELYRACEIARELTLDERFSVGRVIARPYVGTPGRFVRTPNRHDYALKPPSPTVLNNLKESEFDVLAVGKIADIFSGEGITRSYPTRSNEDGVEKTLQLLQSPFHGLLFVNLVDFDALYGHRRDPVGYAKALESFDASLPRLLSRLGKGDLLLLTADHGNDPTFRGTDHTREFVPLIAYAKNDVKGKNLGTRKTFSDVGATIADNFAVPLPQYGESFLTQLLYD